MRPIPAALAVAFVAALLTAVHAARGPIGHAAIVPEPVLALAAAATVGVARRWRRRVRYASA